MSKKAQQEIATPKTQESSKTFNIFSAKQIAYTAVFIALALTMKIVGQFLTLTPSFKITFIYAVWILAGASLGPVGGAIVGFSSDVLGSILFPQGAINLGIIAGNTVYPLIAGLVFWLLPVKSHYAKIIVGGLISLAVCTLGINSLSMWFVYGYSKTMNFWQYLIIMRTFQPVVSAINIAIACMILPVCYKIKLIPRPANKTPKQTVLASPDPAATNI